MLKKIIATAALATLAASSFAAETESKPAAQSTTGFYAGVDVGSGKVNQFGGNRTSYGAVLGYNITENFAVEGNYRRLGSYDTVYGKNDIDQQGVSAIAKMPLTNGFHVYGRLGYNRLEKDGAGNTLHDREGVLYGIGTGYDFGNKLTGRLEVQRPTSSSTNVSASLLYSF